MRLRRFINSLPLLLLLSICAEAQTESAARAHKPKQSQTFQLAKQVTTASTMSFEFEMSGFLYHIADNGNGRRTKGDQTRRFNLGLSGPYAIRAMFYAEYQGNVLLFCGATNLKDMTQAQGFITRLEQPSMRSIWKQTIPDLIGGEPLRVKNYLYVTGRGFVGKINLRNGEYVWNIDDLSALDGGGTFHSFAVPEVVGKEVLFKETDVRGQRAVTVVVDDKTGRLVRFE
jgi:hypothetical protein